MMRLTEAQGSYRRPGAGQALVEFAFVAPLFFLLLFGIIEAGRFIFYYEILNNATREGARYAIVNGANSITSCADGGPTGPPAPNTTSCDPAGDDVRQAVRDAAIGTLGTGVAVTPTWFADNGRGSKDHGRRELHVLDPDPDRSLAQHHRHCGVEPCHQQLAHLALAQASAVRSWCSSQAAS